MSYFDRLKCFCAVSNSLIFGCPIHFPADFCWYPSNDVTQRKLVAPRSSEFVSEFEGWRLDDTSFYDTFLLRRRRVRHENDEDIRLHRSGRSRRHPSSSVCRVDTCYLRDGHDGEHEQIRRCKRPGCNRHEGHIVPHDMRSEVLTQDIIIKAKTEESITHWTQVVLECMEPGTDQGLEVEVDLGGDVLSSGRPRPEQNTRSIQSARSIQSMRIARQKTIMSSQSDLRNNASGPPNYLTQLAVRWLNIGPYLDDVGNLFEKQLSSKTHSMHNNHEIMATSSWSDLRTDFPSSYTKIELKSQEIRLFKLFPGIPGLPLQGSFVSCPITECPSYIALSYAWGDQVIKHNVNLDNGAKIPVGESLWNFLRLQTMRLNKPTHLWIDAICINQEDIHERNHQVGMMKAIYAQATEVYVWLGTEEDDSDHAMDFLMQQSASPLRVRGCGYFPIWSRRTAKGLSALCERPYWRRMWIIQELLHARKITVWCGTKKFDWSDVEALYLKLETIQNSHWFAHHEFLMQIKQSAAATMVWQRAHWRHPETPPPRLSRLIEIFRDWHCTDIRDKVFALVGMATPESAIVPDYALTTREIYFAVMSKVTRDKNNFANLLSQLLGVAGKDVDLWEQFLYVKFHSRLFGNILLSTTGLSTTCIPQRRWSWVQDYVVTGVELGVGGNNDC